jgi:fused signal recognition particle receptor
VKENFEFWVIGGLLGIVLLFVLFYFRQQQRDEKKKIAAKEKDKGRKKEKGRFEEEKPRASILEEVPFPESKLGTFIPQESQVPVPEIKTASWNERLQKGLMVSRSQIWGKLDKIFSLSSIGLGGQKISDEQWESLEEVLYASDLGPKLVGELTETLAEHFKSKSANLDDLKNFLWDFLFAKLSPLHEQDQATAALFDFREQNRSNGNEGGVSGRPRVILIVGINGAGKTTTIGKLATKFSNSGAKVVVGACDTFRAAAVDQLEVWCKRAKAQMVRAKEAADPSGVAFDTLKIATQENADYCIIDTAGRLHTKSNLMEELAKTKKVLSKIDPTAPHHVLLVLDAVTGQNALNQAKEFHKFLGLTGLIFTKCDGSSKAGSAVSIVEELQIPITYIGVGEDVEDLNQFSLVEYLNALLGTERSLNQSGTAER